MRYTATVSGHPEVVRLMLCEVAEGTYLFTYTRAEDGAASADELHLSSDLARQVAQERYGVAPDLWSPLPDPPAGCRQDWIAPTPIKV